MSQKIFTSFFGSGSVQAYPRKTEVRKVGIFMKIFSLGLKRSIKLGLMGVVSLLSLTSCGEYWYEGYSDAYVVDDYEYVDVVDTSNVKNKTVFTFEVEEDHSGDVDVSVVTHNGVKINETNTFGDGCRLVSKATDFSGLKTVKIECDETCKGEFQMEVLNQCTRSAQVKYVVETFDRYGTPTIVDCATLFVTGSEQKLVPISL